jgi:hypothetical protein
MISLISKGRKKGGKSKISVFEILKQGQVETNSGCELRREIGYLQNYPRVFVWN